MPDPSLPTYELFLVLRRARIRYTEYGALAGDLALRLARCPLIGVSLFYRPDTDTALLGLAFDLARFDRGRLVEIHALTAAAGIDLLESAALPEPERRRFYFTYLPLYRSRVVGLRSLDAAFAALAREIGVAGAPELPSVVFPEARRLEVRFRRGDRWQLGRVRSVSASCIFVATGGPPRHGDAVQLELALDFDDPSAPARPVNARAEVPPLRLMLAGTVFQVSAAGAAGDGAAGFGAHLMPKSAAERQRLDEILTAARDSAPGVTPPPRRREARLPLCWPVVVGAGGDRVQTSALDVSPHGMFLAGAAENLGSPRKVELWIPLDDRGGAVATTGRVARTVPLATARARRMACGYGVELQLPATEARRYQQFVERVARRAGRWVLVGAGPRRLDELSGELAAAGYATSGATDAPGLVSKAAAARAPDIVLIDGSLAQANQRAAHAVRRALETRSVPTLQIDGESPGAARSLVDAALLSVFRASPAR